MSTMPGLALPWSRAVTGHDLVVVDVEGNGQQPPEIIEIAVLPLAHGRDVTARDIRSWLVRPERPITGLVTGKVHGITNADVATAPRWSDVAAEIAAALEDRIVVAHNAAVERRVLVDHLPRWRPALLLDTLRLAKTVWPELPGRYGLDNLIRRAALTPLQFPADPRTPGSSRRHRAGYDTWMTAALLLALVEDGGLDWDQALAAARLPDPPHTRRGLAAEDSGESRPDGLW